MEDKNQSLEGSFEELNQIIGKLEKEDISLEDSFQLYHQGMQLLKHCNASIDRVEKELMILEENGMEE